MKIETIVLITYIISLSILFFFGSHGFSMIYYYFRTFQKRKEDLSLDDLVLKDFPLVTIQLPLYNERYVINRLIDAAIRIEYPKDKVEYQILDDSTDDSTEIIEKHIRKYIEQGYDIKLIHRANRKGYKAGALNHSATSPHTGHDRL